MSCFMGVVLWDVVLFHGVLFYGVLGSLIGCLVSLFCGVQTFFMVCCVDLFHGHCVVSWDVVLCCLIFVTLFHLGVFHDM